jgi:hypothetical protein
MNRMQFVRKDMIACMQSIFIHKQRVRFDSVIWIVLTKSIFLFDCWFRYFFHWRHVYIYYPTTTVMMRSHSQRSHRMGRDRMGFFYWRWPTFYMHYYFSVLCPGASRSPTTFSSLWATRRAWDGRRSIPYFLASQPSVDSSWTATALQRRLLLLRCCFSRKKFRRQYNINIFGDNDNLKS